MANSAIGANLVWGYGVINPFASAEPGNRQPDEEPLPDDLPAFLVYMTRNALFAGTDALSRAWTEIYKYFLQLRLLLALERMMREMLAWQAANPMMQFWSGGRQWAPPLPWPLPVPQARPLPSFWGPVAVPALPKPQAATAAGPNDAFGALSPTWATYAATMALPATLLAMAPMFMDSWRLAG